MGKATSRSREARERVPEWHGGARDRALSFLKPELSHYWYPGADGSNYCLHFPGLGFLLSRPYKLFGHEAATWVNPVMVSLTLIGVFLLRLQWTAPSGRHSCLCVAATRAPSRLLENERQVESNNDIPTAAQGAPFVRIQEVPVVLIQQVLDSYI